MSDASTIESGETAAGFASAQGRADLRPIWQTIGVLAFALVWQLVWGVNIDTSWIITMCERVLAGDRLYVDIIETNPPMTLWMYMPAVLAARLAGIRPEIAVHAYFYLACAGGLGFAAYLARLARFPENPALYKLLPVFFALLVILPARSFGEREQFGVALLPPLLVLMAWRLTSDDDDQPGLWPAILAGLCGSVMVLVKPYYAVIILAPALYVAWRRGSLRWLFTVEYWTIGLVCVAYLAAVMQLYPEFVRDVYPALSETYMRDRVPLVTVVRYLPTFLLILFFFWRVRRGVPTPPLIMIVLITATAALVPLIYQSKAWAYHAYPVFALALAAFAYRATQPSDDPLAHGLVPKLSTALIVVATAMPFTFGKLTDPALVQTVRELVRNPKVSLIGEDLQVGHPFTRKIDGTWFASYCSDWMGSMALYFAIEDRKAGNEKLSQHYERIAQSYIDAKAKEFWRAAPDILLLQKGNEGWTDRVIGDPAFAGLMDHYRLIGEDGLRRVYLRNQS